MWKRMWNPATCSCKISKYFTSINDNSVITCDEIIETEGTKPVKTNFNENNVIFETKNVNILLAFLLITIALLNW